jgi:pre-mRNA-splicing factor ATP-dependent RNA helicase DHX16
MSGHKRPRDDGDEMARDVESLRIRARQDYLKKREVERVLLLRQQVEEEAQEERTNPDLTRRELAQFQKNRDILSHAEALLDARERAQDNDVFFMQEAGEVSKSETLNKRTKERDGKSEFALWEEEQARKARTTAGLPSKERVHEDDYEYVFDESVKLNFVKGDTIKGTHKDLSKEQKAFQERLEAAEAEALSIQESRKKLPMYQYREQLVQAVKDHQCLIVSSDTGSGKTTQIPQYILEENANNGLMIAVTQPRRVAAMSVAARVADEQGVRLGAQVGFSVRFEQKVSDKTLIKFMTDGLLLRELIADPTLSEYSVIMLDEAHERTLSTDILLAFLKDLIRHRQDLKLIISSATLNSVKFSSFLDDCPIFRVPGRMYPVETLFASAPEANYVAAAVTTIWQLHLSQKLPGDILVFLTGQDDIELSASELEETGKKLGNRVAPLVVAPIYSSMPSELQQKIFEPTPPGARKVILATNIAETSITVPGITYVIDSGLAKENVYNPATGTETLQATPISRAAAAQRAGRAGRVGPGTCLRLYTKHSWLSDMPEDIYPDMIKSNLMQMVLFLKAMGIENLIDFDYLDAPAPNALITALSSLYELGALATDGRITKLGRQMVEFPTDPQLAAAIIASHKNGCVAEVLTVVAMLGEAANLFFRPKEQKVHADSARARLSSREGGDHVSLLLVYNAWQEAEFSPQWARDNFVQYRSLQRARLVREQLEQLCERVDIPPTSSVGAADAVPILKSLLAGYFSHTATLARDGLHYRTLKNNMTVKIHPSSVLSGETTRPKVVMYHEVVQTSADWMRQVAPIEVAWLGEVAPHFWKGKEKGFEGMGRKMPKGPGAVGQKA